MFRIVDNKVIVFDWPLVANVTSHKKGSNICAPYTISYEGEGKREKKDKEV